MSGSAMSQAVANVRVRPMPDDFSLSVCGRDTESVMVPVTWVVTLWATAAKLRVIYHLDDGAAGCIFTNQAAISHDRRLEMWFSVLMSGLMEAPRQRVAPGGPSGPWLRVWAEGRDWFVPLGTLGNVNGWPVVAEVEGIVPPFVWRHFGKRRLAWEAERRGSEKDKREAQAALTAHEAEIRRIMEAQQRAALAQTGEGG